MIIKFIRKPTYDNRKVFSSLYGRDFYETSEVSYSDDIGNVYEIRKNGITVFKCYKNYHDGRVIPDDNDSFSLIENYISVLKERRKAFVFSSFDMAIFMMASYAHSYNKAIFINNIKKGVDTDNYTQDSSYDYTKGLAEKLFYKFYSNSFDSVDTAVFFALDSMSLGKEGYFDKVYNLMFSNFMSYFFNFPVSPANHLPDLRFASHFFQYVLDNYYLFVVSRFNNSLLIKFNPSLFDKFVMNTLYPAADVAYENMVFSNMVEDGSFNVTNSKYLSFNVRF